MKKKVISAILCGAMVLGTVCPVLAADDKKDDTKTEAAAGDSAKDKKIALVGKAAGNAFFEIAAKSFQETVEAEGGEVQVVYPETATADAQIKVLDNLISQDFDAICISANDVNALQAKLEEAMDAGIKVSSFDSAPNKDSREIFVNHQSAEWDTPVYENFTVNFDLENETGSGAYGESNGEEAEEETEESIAGNAKANSMKEAASETSTEASDEEKKPAGPTTIIVVVNRSPVTLSGKPSYVFVDVFDKIDFDLTRPKGKNIVTSLNGKPAQYMETLHDGDVIDIYWSN